MAAQEFFEKTPTPQEFNRHFGGKRLHVWHGYVHIDHVEGWVENPRIDIQRKHMKELVGDRPLTQDEVFEIMKKDPTIKLKALRDDILKNELKEPLILSKTGQLLDGNRRYFAIRYLLEGMQTTDPNRRDYEKIPCYALSNSSSKEDEEMVLVEENFSPSLKQEWPDYVKAKFIRDETAEGLTSLQISKKYNWQKSKVDETLRIVSIIDEFCSFAEDEINLEDEFGGGLGLSETEAEKVSADNYQFFNEAQKSFRKQLESDVDFKVAFFKWVHEKKFASFPEVRVAYQAWEDPEAREVLMTNSKGAAKEAKAIIDYKKRVIKSKSEAKSRIEDIVRFLEGLSASEIESIPSVTISNVNNALSLFVSMAKAAKSSVKHENY